MKTLCIFITIPILLFGCTNKFNSIEISYRGEWSVINKDIHVYTGAKANSVIIESGKNTILINPGSGIKTYNAIENYTAENNIIITDLLITNSDPSYSNNLSFYRNDKIIYHTTRSLENKNEILMGKLSLGISQVYDYGYKAGLGYSIDDAVFISGGIIESNESYRFGIEVPEIETLNNLKNQKYKLIIPGSGTFLENEQISDYFDERLGAVEYYVKNENSDFLQVNDNIFVFTSTDMPASEFNAAIITSGFDATIFDTGSANAIVTKMKKFIKERNLNIKHIFITHDHYDHLGNLEEFTTPGVEIHRWENSFEGEEVRMGEHLFRIIYTDGHTPKGEHISIEMNREILISGDILVANVKNVSILLVDGNAMKKTLEKFLSNPYKLIIPGHRGVLLDKKLVEVYLSQLK